ncbi:hypothetical protein [Motilimonas eburnea]|uniref:hypothetical protein n=1 Tax=Motilimonas eburnea TaxID=1737488 RepID=UPI001E388987|nr:hypothetical protein [Motilimonas eburnea]MCE2571765.1 hypothetical protein [Motilimonas eburnea]
MLFAFVSRHTPTPEQFQLAQAKGITLEHVGDMDAFTVTSGDVYAKGAYEGVVCVHPAAAMRLCHTFLIGVFENENRAPEGERPSFSAKALHVYDSISN